MVNEYNNYSKSNLLTREQEYELGNIIQEHYKVKSIFQSGEYDKTDEAKIKEMTDIMSKGEIAINKMVNANIGLVYVRARAFKNSYPSGPPLEDLMQEGMIGLMKAMEKFDPEQGNKFSTMAFYWVSQSISRGSNKTARLVRLPENRIIHYSIIKKMTSELEREGYSQEEIDEIIMKKLNISKADMTNILAAAATPASLNKVVGTTGEGDKELIDLIGEENMTESSENILIREELNQVLINSINKLDEMKQDIVYSSVPNLDPDRSMKPVEVKEKYNIQSFKYKKLLNQAYSEILKDLTDAGYTMEDFLGSTN